MFVSAVASGHSDAVHAIRVTAGIRSATGIRQCRLFVTNSSDDLRRGVSLRKKISEREGSYLTARLNGDQFIYGHMSAVNSVRVSRILDGEQPKWNIPQVRASRDFSHPLFRSVFAEITNRLSTHNQINQYEDRA